MIVVGLTGSIAMGKSETAKIFASLGIPVFDSDTAVHDIYSNDTQMIEAIARIAPVAVAAGIVDRQKLSQAISGNPALLSKIEAIVHPAVQQRQKAFLDACRAASHPMVILDIPLLFETGRANTVDKIVVVSAPAELQRQRAMIRPGMTEEKLDLILSRQMPDHEKRRLADYVIDTSTGLGEARRQVKTILDDIHKKPGQE